MKFIAETLIYLAMALLVGGFLGELGARFLYYVDHPTVNVHLP